MDPPDTPHGRTCRRAQPEQKGTRSQWLRLGLQSLVTLGVVTALFAFVDLRSVALHLQHAQPSLYAAAVAMSLVSLAIATQRWRLIVRSDGADPPYLELLRYYLESVFFGLLLPSAVGGDLYRGLRIHGQLGGPRRAAVNILSERLIGLWGICLVGLLGATLSGAYRTPLGRGLVVACAVIGVVSALLVSTAAQGLLNRALRLVRLERLAGAQMQALAQLRDYLSTPRLLASLLLLALVQQLAACVSAYFVGLSAGLSLPLLFYLTAMPLIWLASLVPALGGIGPREGAFVYLAAAAGADRETAAAAAGLLLAVAVALGMMGGLVVLARMVGRRRAAADLDSPA